jgi:hypothetical protein
MAEDAAKGFETAREIAGRVLDDASEARRSVMVEMTPEPSPVPNPEVTPFSVGSHLSSHFLAEMIFNLVDRMVIFNPSASQFGRSCGLSASNSTSLRIG